MSTKEDINKRIARYRNLAGYTQERAAVALNINRNAYARMERAGSPRPEMLKKLALLYNVPAEVLLYGEVSEIAVTPKSEFASQLRSGTVDFKPEDPLILTANEKNAVKLCRTRAPERRSELLKIIADYVKNNNETD